MQTGPQPPVLNRRDRRKLELRERISESAERLFDAQGVHRTTVAEICERADIAQKTFFNHFPSKQHLLRALAEDAMDRLLEMLEDVRKQPGQSATTRIHLFFERFADAAEDAGPMHRELLNELIHAMHDASQDPDESKESQRVRRMHDAFGALVQDGVDQRELTDAHAPATLAELVLGAFYSLMFNHAHREHYPLREQATASARLLCSALEAKPNAH